MNARAEIPAEVAKAVPPAAIVAGNKLFGIDLPTVVALATLLYLAIQIAYLIWKWRHDAVDRRKKNEHVEHDRRRQRGSANRALVAALALSAAGFATWIASEGASPTMVVSGETRFVPHIPTAGDVPTIGHGSTRYEDGRSVRLEDTPITRVRAETLARNLLSEDERRFRESLPGVTVVSGGAATVDPANDPRIAHRMILNGEQPPGQVVPSKQEMMKAAAANPDVYKVSDTSQPGISKITGKGLDVPLYTNVDDPGAAVAGLKEEQIPGLENEGLERFARANAIRQSMIDAQYPRGGNSVIGLTGSRSTDGLSNEQRTILRNALTPHRGAKNGQLTASQQATARGVVGDVQNDATRREEIARRSDADMARFGLDRERLGLDQQRANSDMYANAYRNGEAIGRMEDRAMLNEIRKGLTSEDPSIRAKYERAGEIYGLTKPQEDKFTLSTTADGYGGSVPTVFNPREGQGWRMDKDGNMVAFGVPGSQSRLADMGQDPRAISIRDDKSLTPDQKAKALRELGYS